MKNKGIKIYYIETEYTKLYISLYSLYESNLLSNEELSLNMQILNKAHEKFFI